LDYVFYGTITKTILNSQFSSWRERSIDYRCDDRRFWLSAHHCQVPTPTSQNLELEQETRILEAD
jgi:hypothetical protein